MAEMGFYLASLESSSVSCRSPEIRLARPEVLCQFRFGSVRKAWAKLVTWLNELQKLNQVNLFRRHEL